MKTLLALLVGAATLAAQEPDSASVPWIRHSIQSTRLNETRQVFVALPVGYRASAQAYPVVVILDADDQMQFRSAISNVAFLASRNAIPPLIVVGVPNGKDRTHDMSPPAIGKTAKDFKTAGGVDTFSDFIATEVLSLVRSTYRAKPFTVFAGHSLGGLMAVHIAAMHPGVYTGIVAMSPSLWWNDSTAANQYAGAIARTKTPLRLFVTSGGLEAAINVTTKRFAARLDSIKPANVAFGYRFYPEDTHGLTPMPSLTDGLRFVFEPISTARLPISRIDHASDSAAIVRAILESETAYASGARTFGEPEKLPEPVLNQLGYGVLQELKLAGVAVWIFQRNAAHYPGSANVYDSLGDGLLAKGDTAAAITQFRKAVDVGTRTKDGVVEVSQGKLKMLEKARMPAGKP